MANEETICVKCEHHRFAESGLDVWYNHLCANPEYERLQAVDPVTGKMCYWSKNDLGRSVTTDKEPYCRDMNDGTCKGFVPIGVAVRTS